MVVQPVYQPAVSGKKRAVMLVLCFFFGFFGVHRFYAGKILSGLLYVFTGGVFGIGTLIDFFVILLGTPRDGEGLPIRW